MDPTKVLEIVLNALLGGGGVGALLLAIKAYKSHKKGVPGEETKAIEQAAEPPNAGALIKYWRSEIQAVRNEYNRYKVMAEKRFREDARRIDQLENHIWQQKPPPPPPPEGQSE